MADIGPIRRAVRGFVVLAMSVLLSWCGAARITIPSPTPLGPARLPAPAPDARRAHVVWVSDGDTIVLSGIDVGVVQTTTGARRSRLIGIDTPEVFGPVECFGRQASAFTRRELLGKDVLVDFDIEKTDKYGRALVYVWQTDGRFFNARLAQEGYALQLTIPPDVRYADLFTELVREARAAGRGLWAGC